MPVRFISLSLSLHVSVCVRVHRRVHVLGIFNLWNEWDMLLQGTEISVDTI